VGKNYRASFAKFHIRPGWPQRRIAELWNGAALGHSGKSSCVWVWNL